MRIEVIGDATLYLGRWEDIGAIQKTPGDLVLTDPPYGIGVKTTTIKSKRDIDKRDGVRRGYDWPEIEGDDKRFDPSPLLVFQRAVLWGANNYADALPVSHCWFSWDRKVGKASDSDITDCELAWVRGLPYKTVRCFRHMWAGFQRDSEVGEKHFHPAQKPVSLMMWCLSFFPAVEHVFDPYMGSGPVGVACVQAGRSYTGIEVNPAYFETALRRIEAAHRQGDLLRDIQPAPKLVTGDLWGG